MKAFFIGLLVVAVAVGIPVGVQLIGKAKKEGQAKAAMEEVFIRCPAEVEEFARGEYGVLHGWAFSKVKDIVKGRGDKKFDVGLYKRFVLSALAEKVEAAEVEDGLLALQLAASGEDISISNRWRDKEVELDPEVELLFKKPLLKKVDVAGGEEADSEKPAPAKVPDGPAKPKGEKAPAEKGEDGEEKMAGGLRDGSDIDDKPVGAVLRKKGEDVSVFELLTSGGKPVATGEGGESAETEGSEGEMEKGEGAEMEGDGKMEGE